MNRRGRILGLAIAAVVVVVIGLPVASEFLVFEYWTRETALVAPIKVTRVEAGALTLEDGRVVRPAGIRRRDNVDASEYDRALRTAVAQGIVVKRGLGDGRVFLVAEPKFYNWCGTHDAFRHWAGTYLQLPLSEFLVHSRYAQFEAAEEGLTPRERWRLEGIGHIAKGEEGLLRISTNGASFRYEGSERFLCDPDGLIEAMWKPPPE
jgi:hypothetical protein